MDSSEFLGGTEHSAVFLSLFALVGASVAFAISGISYLQKVRDTPLYKDTKSNRVRRTASNAIAEAFFKNRKMMIFSTLVYAFFFAIIDAIIVYQPTVDFAKAYGVAGIESSLVVSCCGPPGYVPVGLVYFPSWHLGLELIPTSILLMLLISVLVALNISLIYSAISASRANSVAKTKGSLGGVFGAAIGLFAGCPTCAAAFFLSMIAGSGATVFSIYISQYQALIATLTVPILLISIYSQARSVSIIIRGCEV